MAPLSIKIIKCIVHKATTKINKKYEYHNQFCFRLRLSEKFIAIRYKDEHELMRNLTILYIWSWKRLNQSPSNRQLSIRLIRCSCTSDFRSKAPTKVELKKRSVAYVRVLQNMARFILYTCTVVRICVIRSKHGNLYSN